MGPGIAAVVAWSSVALAQPTEPTDPETPPATQEPASSEAPAGPTAAPSEAPASDARPPASAIAPSSGVGATAATSENVGAGRESPENSVDEDDDGELAELLEGQDLDGYDRPQILNMYGFFDFGLRKFFVDERSIVNVGIETPASSFVLGNLNLFFDAKPSDEWRGLLELRFTNLPHGQEQQFATPFGDEYERVDRNIEDTTSPNGRGNVLLSSTIIERAWAEWEGSDAFSLRVGWWFTPYGIWNIDHGTPTLISLVLPEAQLRQYFPLRQLGVQALGSFFTSSWELGYRAYLSNGRTFGQLDLTEDKAVGARLFARTRSEGIALQLGASGYYGTFTDVERRVTSFSPFLVSRDETVAAEEFGLAADVSLDAGPFRLRAESVLNRTTYEEGKREASFGAPGRFLPDSYRWDHYLLGAYRLPWLGLEPYVYTELAHAPSTVADTSVVGSMGFNMYFAPEAQLKFQYTRVYFYDLLQDLPGNPKLNNFQVADARLVFVF